MKNLDLVATPLSLPAVSCGWVVAQSCDDPRSDGGQTPPQIVRHLNWSRGQRIGQDDWACGASVDYRGLHLRQPLRGYQWREIDCRSILAGTATGVIFDVVPDAR
jgi:Ni/Co efflux regulator RcnB